MKKRLLIACLISVAATASSSAAIIIANAGFEADNLADATDAFTNNSLSDWDGATTTAFNHGAVDPAPGGASDAPVTGENAAYMVGVSFISQNVSVTEDISVGDQITFTFDAWRNNDAGNAVTLDFAGLGAQTVDLGIGNNDGTTNNITFITTSTISTGTALLRFDQSAGGQSRLDNLSVTITSIPEPSSTALLGLGGLALILRRRK